MRETLFLAAAQVTCIIGMGWLALAMQSHWEQVRKDAHSRKSSMVLRWLGAAMLVVSLGLCLAADHASMAILVWVMVLAASALVIAFTLTWRPQWLRVLSWGRHG